MTTESQTPVTKPEIRRPKIRRRATQKVDWRFYSQLFWALITVWIGWEFIRFVGFYESGAVGDPPVRPPGVESFLPISGLMGLRDWWNTGILNQVHPAATVILLLAIIVSVIWKKSFCGWVCPVGFISENIAAAGRKIHRWKGKLHWFPDGTLRSVKYMLLAFFVWAVFYQMTPESIRIFIESPYNRVADVKMLKFFTDITPFALWTLVGLVGLSFLIGGFWCRFLCPYGALVGLVSFLSPYKITRKSDSCTGCDRCNAVCPAHIDITALKRVRSDECNACLQCVDVCPVNEALEFSLPQNRWKLSRRSTLIAVTAVFVLGIGLAMATGNWQNNVTSDEYRRRISELDSPKYQHNQGRVPDYNEED